MAPPRAGFTVTKKLGAAVERNRIRRRLKEAVRIAAGDCLRPGFDYVFVGRAGTAGREFSKLVADILTALDYLHHAHDRAARAAGSEVGGEPGAAGSSMNDNKNLILAIVLSTLVIIRLAVPLFRSATSATAAATAAAERSSRRRLRSSRRPRPPPVSRQPCRVGWRPVTRCWPDPPAFPSTTPAVSGSLNLKGAQLDDLRLKNYRETVEPGSPTIVLLSPFGAKDAYAADTGFSAAPGSQIKLPTPASVWTAPAGAKLTPCNPGHADLRQR